MDKHPVEGQEVEIKYKITNSKGEIIDSTEGRTHFKFIVGDYQNIMKCVSDAVTTMKHDEKKTIEIDTEKEPNILDILGEDKKKLEENKKLTMEIELIRFNNLTRSIFELTDDEKFEYAKKLKADFAGLYKENKYKEGVDILKEAIGVMDRINKENTTEEMKKLKISLMLNECNCLNNLKEYLSSERIGKQIIEMDPKSLKGYYYLANAYVYQDEFKEATTCYNKLYELIPDKNDPGVVALNNTINKRRKEKEEIARRKFKAYFAQKDENK